MLVDRSCTSAAHARRDLVSFTAGTRTGNDQWLATPLSSTGYSEPGRRGRMEQTSNCRLDLRLPLSLHIRRPERVARFRMVLMLVSRNSFSFTTLGDDFLQINWIGTCIVTDPKPS